jgi:hypothetical protein
MAYDAGASGQDEAGGWPFEEQTKGGHNKKGVAVCTLLSRPLPGRRSI